MTPKRLTRYLSRVLLGAVSGLAALQCSKPQTDATQSSFTESQLSTLPVRVPQDEPLMRISDDTTEFGRVVAGCFLKAGRAAVLSLAQKTVLLLDPGAQLPVQQLGRGGTGPGEFDQPWGISCFSDDSASVLEVARVTTISTSEPMLTTVAYQPMQGEQLLQLVAQLSGDRFLLRALDRNRSLSLGTSRDTVELLIATGVADQSVRTTPIARLPGAEQVRARSSGGGITTAVHPFGRGLLTAGHRGAVYLMDTGTNELIAFNVNDLSKRSVRLNIRGRPLDRALIAEYRDKRLSAARSPEARDQAQLLLDNTEMSETLPPFDRMLALAEGGVLLRETLVAGETITRWLEVDRNLKPRAHWHIAADLRVLAASDGNLVGVRDTPDFEELFFLRMGAAHP